MGIEDLKFRLASQYVKTDKANADETKAKRQPQVEEQKPAPQTKEVGDKLLTEDPRMAVMKDLGFIQTGKVNTTPEAVAARATTFFETAPEMQELNAMFGIDTQNAFLAGIKLKGIDTDKLNKHMAKGLDSTTAQAFTTNLENIATLLA